MLVDPDFFVPFADGSHLTGWADDRRTAEEIERLSPVDVDAYFARRSFWDRARDALRPDDDRDVWLGEPPSREEIEDQARRSRPGRRPVRAVPGRPSAELLQGRAARGGLCRPGGDRDQRLAVRPGHGVDRVPSRQRPPRRARPVPGASFPGGWVSCRPPSPRPRPRPAPCWSPMLRWPRIRPGEGVELESGDVVRAPVVVANADPARTVALLGADAPSALVAAVDSRAPPSPVVKVTFALRGPPRLRRAARDPGPGRDHHRCRRHARLVSRRPPRLDQRRALVRAVLPDAVRPVDRPGGQARAQRVLPVRAVRVRPTARGTSVGTTSATGSPPRSSGSPPGSPISSRPATSTGRPTSRAASA